MSDALIITHDGGDKIPAAQLNGTVSGATYDDGTNTGTANFGGNLFGDTGQVTAGTSYNLTADSTTPTKFYSSGGGIAAGTALTESKGLDLSKATVRIIWTSESGDNSATLRKWSGPDA